MCWDYSLFYCIYVIIPDLLRMLNVVSDLLNVDIFILYLIRTCWEPSNWLIYLDIIVIFIRIVYYGW